MIFFVTLSGIITLRKIGGDSLFGHIFAPLSLNNVTNDSLNLYVSYTNFAFYGLTFRIFESEVRLRHFAHAMGSMLINKVSSYRVKNSARMTVVKKSSSLIQRVGIQMSSLYQAVRYNWQAAVELLYYYTDTTMLVSCVLCQVPYWFSAECKSGWYRIPVSCKVKRYRYW